jgi:hypothetical protein
MPEKRRRYDPDFRAGAVEIVRETSGSVPQKAETGGQTRGAQAYVERRVKRLPPISELPTGDQRNVRGHEKVRLWPAEVLAGGHQMSPFLWLFGFWRGGACRRSARNRAAGSRD